MEEFHSLTRDSSKREIAEHTCQSWSLFLSYYSLYHTIAIRRVRSASVNNNWDQLYNNFKSWCHYGSLSMKSMTAQDIDKHWHTYTIVRVLRRGRNPRRGYRRFEEHDGQSDKSRSISQQSPFSLTVSTQPIFDVGADGLASSANSSSSPSTSHATEWAVVPRLSTRAYVPNCVRTQSAPCPTPKSSYILCGADGEHVDSVEAVADEKETKVEHSSTPSSMPELASHPQSVWSDFSVDAFGQKCGDSGCDYNINNDSCYKVKGDPLDLMLQALTFFRSRREFDDDCSRMYGDELHNNMKLALRVWERCNPSSFKELTCGRVSSAHAQLSEPDWNSLVYVRFRAHMLREQSTQHITACVTERAEDFSRRVDFSVVHNSASQMQPCRSSNPVQRYEQPISPVHIWPHSAPLVSSLASSSFACSPCSPPRTEEMHSDTQEEGSMRSQQWSPYRNGRIALVLEQLIQQQAELVLLCEQLRGERHEADHCVGPRCTSSVIHDDDESVSLWPQSHIPSARRHQS